MFGVATSTVAGALATVAGALAPSAIFSAALFGEGVRVIFPTDPFTGGRLDWWPLWWRFGSPHIRSVR